MEYNIYQINAFSNKIFSGNPAAVCPLNQFLTDEMMQAIAAENNLSETAFYVKNNNAYNIRWFTPNGEVDLCGHATLAASYVIFNEENSEKNDITFNSKSGSLYVKKLKGNSIQLNLPRRDIETSHLIPGLVESFGNKPQEVYRYRNDYMLIYDNPEKIQSIAPDFALLKSLDIRAVMISSTGHNGYDFVSRFFSPKSGINEDPVTGAAHCMLAPYWSTILGKSKLSARQLSHRGGDIWCEVTDDRVFLSGYATPYMKGKLYI